MRYCDLLISFDEEQSKTFLENADREQLAAVVAVGGFVSEIGEIIKKNDPVLHKRLKKIISVHIQKGT